MSEIDWSKAPEGANGYVADDKEGPAPAIWYRRNGEALHWTLVGQPVKWQRSTRIRDKIIWREDQVAAWNGEGLPPVGTVCVTKHEGEELKIKILAYANASGSEHGPHYVMACQMVGIRESQLFAWLAHMCEFSPIKTPEQIAADEREREIEALATAIMDVEHVSGRVMAERLHSRGCRMTEGGAA